MTDTIFRRFIAKATARLKGKRMPKIAQALLLLVVVCGAVAGCGGPRDGSGPAIYYENDIHHGYPGPGVTDPSAAT